MKHNKTIINVALAIALTSGIYFATKGNYFIAGMLIGIYVGLDR